MVKISPRQNLVWTPRGSKKIYEGNVRLGIRYSRNLEGLGINMQTAFERYLDPDVNSWNNWNQRKIKK